MKCPENQFKKCIESDCAKWSVVPTRDVKTGEVKVEGKCAIMRLVDIQLENGKYMASLQRTMEEHRNESIKRQNAVIEGLVDKRIL